MTNYNNRRPGQNQSPRTNPQGNRPYAQRQPDAQQTQGQGPSSPYGFVRFPGGIDGPVRSDINETYADAAGLLTGWLDVKLTNTTRLIIPDGTKVTEDQKQHKTLPFFRLPDGTPAIPGSELRGLVRSVYEAASDSCLPFLLDDKITSMRLPLYAALKQRGLLFRKENRWELWSAFDHRHKLVDRGERESVFQKGQFEGYSTGARVYFKMDGEDAVLQTKNGPGVEIGWLQFSIPVRHDLFRDPYSIHFLTRNRLIHIWDDDEPYEALCEELGREERKTLRDGAEKPHQALLERLKGVRRGEKDCIPVFYLETTARGGGKAYYLSPSSVGRINQLRKWKDIMGMYGPCTCGEKSCPACQLFGNVQGDWSVKSRVQFSDAIPTEEIPPQDLAWSTLPILGGPKPTAFEMYIRRPGNAHFWNYDIRATKAGRDRDADFRQREDFTPNGRKFYWHSMQEKTCAERSGQNTTMETLARNHSFRFRLTFTRITPLQLRQLIWVLTLGENTAGSKLQHKLGHGRPVGYGSVKMVVEGLTLRKLVMREGRTEYLLEKRTVPGRIGCPFAKDDAHLAALTDLLTISGLDAIPAQQTMYPAVNGQIFKWFADNRRNPNSLVILHDVQQRAAGKVVRPVYETAEDIAALTPT